MTVSKKQHVPNSMVSLSSKKVSRQVKQLTFSFPGEDFLVSTRILGSRKKTQMDRKFSLNKKFPPSYKLAFLIFMSVCLKCYFVSQNICEKLV